MDRKPVETRQHALQENLTKPIQAQNQNQKFKAVSSGPRLSGADKISELQKPLDESLISDIESSPPPVAVPPGLEANAIKQNKKISSKLGLKESPGIVVCNGLDISAPEDSLQFECEAEGGDEELEEMLRQPEQREDIDPNDLLEQTSSRAISPQTASSIKNLNYDPETDKKIQWLGIQSGNGSIEIIPSIPKTETNSKVQEEQYSEDTDEDLEIKPVSFHRFFSYNTRRDNIMLAIGTFSAVVAGLLLPSISLIMGTIAQNFGDGDIDPSEMTEIIGNTAKIIGVIASVIAIFSYIFFAFWQHLAENISLNLRKKYLKALLNQEVAYFEKIKIEEIPSKMGEIFETVQNSVGEKYANLIFAVFQGIGGCIYAFFTGKRLALYLIGYLPIFGLILGTFGIMVKNITEAKFDIVKQMGGVVSETLYAIKVVSSFGMEEKEIEKFKIWNKKTEIMGKKFVDRFSFMYGIMKFAIFSFYTFAFYIGSQMIYEGTPNSNSDDQPYTPQEVITILIALITGYISLIASLPSIQAVVAAKQVGGEIFAVIDRVPKIRDGVEAVDHFTLKKEIEFINVTFKYPTAPKEQRNLFQGVSFKIFAGQSTAIVGPSGYGKSTIVQMLERFYEPTVGQDGSLGQILLDGLNIKKIKLKDLRESIGYVPQEPTLIIGTIRENLLFGNKDASDLELESALVKANAQFVFDFEDKLDTFIGTSSVVNLSGGQKQRLAIARALLKNPMILILDEATSALDPQSEMEVQKAIEMIELNQSYSESEEKRLTILIIAHRLTSIKGASNLLFIEQRDQITSYKKGTPEYEIVFNKLKNITYVHGEGEEEEFEREKVQSILSNSIFSNQQSILSINKQDINQDEKYTQAYSKSAIRISCALEQELSNKEEINKLRGSIDYSRKISMKESRIAALLELDDLPGPAKVIGFKEIMKFYEPGWLAIVGIVASMFASLQLPVFGFLLSKMIFVLMLDPSSDDFMEQRNFWVSMFAIMTVGMFTSSFLQRLAFGYCSENLTKTLRLKLFEAILYKHIGWFDNKNRAPGVLGNIIQEDITKLNGLTSEVYSVAVEAILGILVSCGMCLYFSWQVGLIAIVLSPLMVFGGFFMSAFQWSQGKVDDAYTESNALLSDIIMNYRTIISLGEKNVDFILYRYYQLLDGPYKQGIKRAHVSAILFAYSQSIRFVFVAISFYLASLVIEKFNMDAKQKSDVFTGVYIMFVGAIGSGVSVSQMPSKSKAEKSANKVFSIIDEPSKIDPRIKGVGRNMKVETGTVTFENVNFKYPSRNQKVLENFSLTIKGNESVALVGHSGSGKSTIASLLLRFYNKQSGSIKIDGQDIEKYSVRQLRENVAIVMQEPLLFNESIQENIRYGNQAANEKDIFEASEKANCLNFIQNSIDYLYIPEVRIKIEREFEEGLRDLSGKYQQFGLVRDYLRTQPLVIEEKFLIRELIENANESFFQLVDTNPTLLIEVLQLVIRNRADTQEKSWRHVLMSFLWELNFIPKMRKTIQEKSYLFQEPQMMELTDYIQLYPWKFDLQALQEFFQLREGAGEAEFQSCQQSELGSEFKDDKNSLKLFLRGYNGRKRFNAIQQKNLRQFTTKKSDLKVNLHPGFNKLCGLRGCKLSGGQKQRVAIARALIRNPKVLILDEATSALDEKSQEIVQQALDIAMKGRTSIVIAHRLSTVKKCDRIVVLNNGKVVEEGTYLDLSDDPNSYFFKLKAGLQMDGD